MKCTECNRRIRPVVAIDIDGTLGDFHSHFLNFAAAYLGIPPSILAGYGGLFQFRDWFISRTGASEAIWRDIKLAYRQGAMKRSMPIGPYASTMCHALQSADVELWLTTTRPYQRLDNVDPDTRFWLKNHRIDYYGLVYDEEKYQQLHEIVGTGRVVAVLDDLHEECLRAATYFGDEVPIQYLNGYNELAIGNYAVAQNLREAQQVIEARIQRWHDVH